MATKYFCAHCDEEFTLDQPEHEPRCPKCMRKGGVEPVGEASRSSALSRPALVVPAAALLIAGLIVFLYQARQPGLEETPPLRPLDPQELAAYLERDEAQVGRHASFLTLSTSGGDWPEAPADLAQRLHAESSRWSLERALPREVFTVEEALGAMAGSEERLELYPIELAATMTALLRERGVDAMVAEVWELEGEQAPLDPSGMLGYFMTAVLEPDGTEPSAYYDPWGGRGEVTPAAARVLRDTEVIGAALGIEAARVFAHSGDSQAALPMVETAIFLDRLSPSHRVVHATVLADAGGLPQALRELEGAIQLRPDGPRRLSMAQLRLAHAGRLAANGDPSAAEEAIIAATREISEIIDQRPRYARAHLTLATVHLGLGDLERARVDLETAEQLNPDSPMVWAVWAQYDLATENPTSAADKMSRALALDPQNWQLRVQAAGIFYGAGNEEAARRNADEAVRLVADDRRGKLRSYLDELLGPAQLELPDPAPEEPAGAATPEASEPALMLGDPSDLRLRDPDQELKLELGE